MISRKDEDRQVIDGIIGNIVWLAEIIEMSDHLGVGLTRHHLMQATARCVRDSFRGDRTDVAAASLHRYHLDIQVAYLDDVGCPDKRRRKLHKAWRMARACQFLISAAHHACVVIEHTLGRPGETYTTLAQVDFGFALAEWDLGVHGVASGVTESGLEVAKTHA